MKTASQVRQKTSKPRILIVIYAYPPADRMGGPPVSSRLLAEALADAGAQVQVLTSDYNGARRLALADRRVVQRGVSVHYCHWPRGSFWPVSPQLCLQLVRNRDRFDAVLLTVSWSVYSLILGWICRFFCIPYIAYPRGSFDPGSLRKSALKKKVFWRLGGRGLYTRAVRVVALNDDERSFLNAHGVGERVCVIPNAVEPPAGPVPERERLQSFLPDVSDRPYCLFLGRLERQKGLNLLVNAFAKARCRHHLFLVLGGEGEAAYIGKLKEQITASGLEEKIHFAGLLGGEKKHMSLAHCEFFILPSLGEGMPMSVLEAMSFGKAVVITEACHLPEVKEAGAGLVVASNSEDLARAIDRMMTSPTSLREMGNRARELAEAKFSPARLAEDTLTMVEDVIEEKSS